MLSTERKESNSIEKGRKKPVRVRTGFCLWNTLRSSRGSTRIIVMGLVPSDQPEMLYAGPGEGEWDEESSFLCVDISTHGVRVEMKRAFNRPHEDLPHSKIPQPEQPHAPTPVQREEERRADKKDLAQEANRIRKKKLQRRGWIR